MKRIIGISHFVKIAVACFLIQSCAPKGVNRMEQPNVIIVMTDDQGYGDIAANGNPYIETPNLDALHGEAIRLENFHVSPTCSPTRAALMTGKYNHRVGVWHTVIGRERVRKSETLMANIFNQNGYATGIFGKWHLGDDYPFRPSDRGFQEAIIHKAGAVNQMADYWDNDRMNDTYFHNNEAKKYEGFSSDVFFGEAIKFMESNKEQPFFAYIPTSAPHGPNNVIQEWADKYLKKGLDENVSNFYASIERIDHNLGELRRYLKESGLEENTILVFLTDNGTTMPNNHNRAGMRGSKGSIYEGGHRVPCYIYWPSRNFLGGLEYNDLTSVMDLFPTLMELCGLEAKEPILFDGQSLMPLLNGQKTRLNDRYLLVEQQRVPQPVKWKTNVMMNKQWRLVNGKELFNMAEDFGQQLNVAPEHPKVVEDLRREYERIWDDISIHDNEYEALILGSDHDSETLLTAQDWYWSNNSTPQKLVVGQGSVRKGLISNGTWPVEVASEGEYLLELRRWPKESGLALNASTAEIRSEDNDIALKKWGDKPQGKSFNIIKARLKIGGEEKVATVDPSDQQVSFPFYLKKGRTNIKTWLYTSEGDTLGAYYVNVRQLD